MRVVMRWFKHYSDASDSVKLNKLIDELGVEGYGRYWLLLELLAGEFDGKSTKFRVHSRKISAKVQIKFSKKLETFMGKLSDFSLLTYNLHQKVYEIECPIILELQNKHSKYNRKRVVGESQMATLDKEEDKEEDKELDKDRDIYRKRKKKKSRPVLPRNIVKQLFDLEFNSVTFDGVQNTAYWLIFESLDPAPCPNLIKMALRECNLDWNSMKNSDVWTNNNQTFGMFLKHAHKYLQVAKAKLDMNTAFEAKQAAMEKSYAKDFIGSEQE